MYRRYLQIIFGLCGIVAAFVLAMAVWLGPLSGDLTRVGGYSERDFGWNGTERIFSPPLAEPGRRGGAYDIVVVGDSFSSRTSPDRQTRDGSFWTDFLAADTGRRVGVFDVSRTPMEDFLASPAYRVYPPRLVVLELSERWLSRRLAGPTTCPVAAPDLPSHLSAVPDPLIPGGYRRPLLPRTIETAASEAADYLKKAFWRRVFHRDATPAVRLPLSRADLFTSRRPGELLIFADDLDKVHWSAADWTMMRCRLLRYQREVTSNGTTAFLFLLAPDKSTVYADYLPPEPWQIDAAERLADPPGLAMPRLDLVLRAAVAAGTRDVYLPNDSHWSTTGSRIVARAVLQYLQPSPAPAVAGIGDTTASR